jgi:hypothetical protein
VRRLWLLALLPKQELLATNQGDQQCQQGKQALLDMQWRDPQSGGTLATHPEPPIGRDLWRALVYQMSRLLRLLQPACQLFVIKNINKINKLNGC